MKTFSVLRHAHTPLDIRSVLAVFLCLTQQARSQTINLGSAADFAVLAGSGITVTDPTIIIGDIGTYDTPTITGIGNVTLYGTNHAGDITTQNAKTDLGFAYNEAQGRTPTTTYAAIFDLAGLTLAAGVYNDPSSFAINGDLILDAAGNPNAIWIFQAGSTLITGSGSNVILTGGAQASNVFWQVGSSATLGTGSDFAGNILALTDITLETGATVDGRTLAQNGAVTLDSNIITVPEPSILALLPLCLFVSSRKRH